MKAEENIFNFSLKSLAELDEISSAFLRHKLSHSHYIMSTAKDLSCRRAFVVVLKKLCAPLRDVITVKRHPHRFLYDIECKWNVNKTSQIRGHGSNKTKKISVLDIHRIKEWNERKSWRSKREEEDENGNEMGISYFSRLVWYVSVRRITMRIFSE